METVLFWVTGDVRVDSSSSALIAGDTVDVVGNITVWDASSMKVQNDALITGNVSVSTNSVFGTYGNAGVVVTGILDCSDFSGAMLNIQGNTQANTFTVDGSAIQFGVNDYDCGHVYAAPE